MATAPNNPFDVALSAPLARATRVNRYFGKPVDGNPANDSYRCELCGAWIEYRDLGKVLAHEGRYRILRSDQGQRCAHQPPRWW